MKIKIVMDSGKEYFVEEPHYSTNQFLESFYSNTKLPMSGTVSALKNAFATLDRDETIIINPSHISSIEVLEK